MYIKKFLFKDGLQFKVFFLENLKIIIISFIEFKIFIFFINYKNNFIFFIVSHMSLVPSLTISRKKRD